MSSVDAPVNKNVEPLIKKSPCASCRGERNCKILGMYEERGGDDYFQWHTDWLILQCCGCEHTFVQTVSTNSEDYKHDYGPDGETLTEYNECVRYWPAQLKRSRPEWMTEVGIDAENVETLSATLRELYIALDNDLNALSGIGIRTSFDIASQLLKIDPNLSFAKKLDALVDGGHISKLDKERLEILIDAGSASAHRGWLPTTEDLGVMMDMLEHFIHDAFVAPQRKVKLDVKLDKVKAKVPVRKVRTKS